MRTQHGAWEVPGCVQRRRREECRKGPFSGFFLAECWVHMPFGNLRQGGYLDLNCKAESCPAGAPGPYQSCSTRFVVCS